MDSDKRASLPGFSEDGPELPDYMPLNLQLLPKCGDFTVLLQRDVERDGRTYVAFQDYHVLSHLLEKEYYLKYEAVHPDFIVSESRRQDRRGHNEVTPLRRLEAAAIFRHLYGPDFIMLEITTVTDPITLMGCVCNSGVMTGPTGGTYEFSAGDYLVMYVGKVYVVHPVTLLAHYEECK